MRFAPDGTVSSTAPPSAVPSADEEVLATGDRSRPLTSSSSGSGGAHSSVGSRRAGTAARVSFGSDGVTLSPGGSAQNGAPKLGLRPTGDGDEKAPGTRMLPREWDCQLMDN